MCLLLLKLLSSLWENATRLKKNTQKNKFPFFFHLKLQSEILFWNGEARMERKAHTETSKILLDLREWDYLSHSCGCMFALCSPKSWLPVCASPGWGAEGEMGLPVPPQCPSLSFLLLQLFLWAWLWRGSACGFCVWEDCRDLKGCLWGEAELHVCTLWITHLGLAHSLCLGYSFTQAKTHMGAFRLSTCANWGISYLTIGPKPENWWFTGSAKITGRILRWRDLALHYWNWRSFADLHQLRIWA